jgi:hypothetical protein
MLIFFFLFISITKSYYMDMDNKQAIDPIVSNQIDKKKKKNRLLLGESLDT